RVPGLRRRAAHRQRRACAQGRRRQPRGAARRDDEGGFPIAARELQVQHQPLSDPGLLSGQGRQAPRRQVRDANRQEGVRELRRYARQGLSDEVRSAGIWRRSSSCGFGLRPSPRKLSGRGSRTETTAPPRIPMSTTLLAVQILNGLQLGVLLFLVAAGLTLVFGVMDFINLAHGVQYMLGAYLAVAFYALTGSFLSALVLALAAALAFGLVL